MERDRLIALAPQYYTIAICAFFDRTDVASSNTVWNNARLENGPVFWRTLEMLVEMQMLTAVKDDFGPPIYKRAPNFEKEWNKLKETPDTPYSRYALDPQSALWIIAALENVHEALKKQKIKEEDLKKPDAEWEPLPIERQDPKLQKATKELDQTIAAVEADNGYSATLPEERAFVVENLKEATERLKKEDAISYAYLKRKVIDVLDVLIRRFGKAAVGLTAQAARAALFDWLKELGGKMLHWIM
jgi:hypothetical protein